MPFRAGPAEPSNPFLLTVSRKPLTALEHPMPVGIVSHRYSLVQHRDVAMRCREGLVDAGVNSENLRYEVGVPELGEWMNFRIYFPEEYSLQDSHGERVDLRLECFNAVDASSRLIVLFGWYRLVCANGMVSRRQCQKTDCEHQQEGDVGAVDGGVEKVQVHCPGRPTPRRPCR
ncbi:MAG: DUF932 domain-containing protein [Acidobacteria bacterium]|nr:DUF932 domain-containing protein [Acidobacteriota bacterium]